MKKFWLRTAAAFMAVCIILSVNIYAVDSSKMYDVVLNSGDIVEEKEHTETRFSSSTVPGYKYVNTVTFNATGADPIVVNNNAFTGYSYSAKNVRNIVFNGDGDIILDTQAFMSTRIKDLVLPENVSYAENAYGVFSDCSYLLEVTLSNKICPQMFKQCWNLHSVTFPDDFCQTELPDSMFEECPNLFIESIPSSVKKLGAKCFSLCDFPSVFEIPSTVEEIGEQCFSRCTMYTLILNEGLKTIGKEAFLSTDLTSVTIPSSVTEIGDRAFGYYSTGSKKENFTIYGYSGTAAETYAKNNKFDFVEITAPQSKETYTLVVNDRVSNEDVRGKIFDLVIVNPGATINEGDFDGAMINNIIFNEDDSGKKITLCCLALQNQNFKTLYLPKNISFIEDYGREDYTTHAFSGCHNLEKVTIACKTCYQMFSQCTSLKEVYFTSDFNDDDIEDLFVDCFSLEKVVFSNRITSIRTFGSNTFYKCFNLKEVYLPKTRCLYDRAFVSCTSLEKIVCFGFTEIMDIAFSEMEQKVTVYAPSKFREFYERQSYEGSLYIYEPLSLVYENDYTPTWGSVNDYGFTVSGRADKLQVIEANGGTRTVTRNSPNVVIKSYDINGNEVSSLSRELDYEVWTVNTRLTPDTELQVHAKYNNEWVDATYRFSVSTLYSDKTLKKAELSSTSGGQGMVDCNIVTGSGVSKVRVEYEDGMTSTYNSGYATLDVENMTYTYDITVKAYRTGEIPYKIYIKTPSGWQYATTLTYTAE